MRAATIRDGEVLVADHPDPQPGHGEVLVRVQAAGINGADMLQRARRLSRAARLARGHPGARAGRRRRGEPGPASPASPRATA